MWTNVSGTSNSDNYDIAILIEIYRFELLASFNWFIYHKSICFFLMHYRLENNKMWIYLEIQEWTFEFDNGLNHIIEVNSRINCLQESIVINMCSSVCFVAFSTCYYNFSAVIYLLKKFSIKYSIFYICVFIRNEGDFLCS